MFCLVHLSSYVFLSILRFYISNLTSRRFLLRTGKRKNTDLSYTQDISPLTRHPHFICFYFALLSILAEQHFQFGPCLMPISL